MIGSTLGNADSPLEKSPSGSSLGLSQIAVASDLVFSWLAVTFNEPRSFSSVECCPYNNVTFKDPKAVSEKSPS